MTDVDLVTLADAGAFVSHEHQSHLADAVRPRNLYLSSNCELGYLPTVVAEQKVQRLGEAARTVKELVSV